MSGATRHWDEFYSGRYDFPPSQFAAFVAGELDGRCRIVDLGCGNGRDSQFFASLGHDVVGVDRSTVAIQRDSAENRFGNLTYLAADAGELELGSLEASQLPLCVYARFFWHAIDEDTEDRLLARLARDMPPGSRLFLEYRTLKDASTEKLFGEHYRRYVDHRALTGRLVEAGLMIDYEVEGRGMAKYRSEDPWIGRVAARR